MRQQLQADLAAGDADLVFVDDHPPAPVVNGQRVLTYAQWLAEPASSRHMNVAIANSQVRQKLVERCAADGVQFFEARAANVVQLDDVQLSDGAVLCPFVTLTRRGAPRGDVQQGELLDGHRDPRVLKRVCRLVWHGACRGAGQWHPCTGCGAKGFGCGAGR